jgi:hypothetical protein
MYAKINRVVMRFLFGIPLLLIASYEATLDPRKNSFTRAWFEANEEEDGENTEYQDPDVEEDDGKISKTKFADLIKDFPNTSQVSAEFGWHTECINISNFRVWSLPSSMRYRVYGCALISLRLHSKKPAKCRAKNKSRGDTGTMTLF